MGKRSLTQRQDGRFITIEGGDGVGKTTQTTRLAMALRADGIETLTTREPGGSPGAEDIRQLLVEGDPERWDAMTELLLLCAARRDHVQRVIAPALARGVWVVCDRFIDSTTAYQGYAGGLGSETIRRLHRLALGPFRPHLTALIDLPVETGLQRRHASEPAAEQRFERFDPAFHHQVRRGFKAVARQEPQRIVVIDGSGAEETVAAQIRAAVWERLRRPDDASPPCR